ncbi:p26-a [Orgyia leucostigma nucleopolyhedrovirus]|uniref:p26-a n=1 Tax=Orgyia leucostigma nucleopolyhedrovirus TaxID=490711 RepID=B0FDN8_9ABAC|nr:p26-a [Orgyia leucostigma nucleopolyhedrovirus]ABY65746.1 p26-a [Orgyia leucostigma nucleopolyhedrovirus]
MNMVWSDRVILLVVTAITMLAIDAAALSVGNVKYSIDRATKTIDVYSVNNASSVFKIVEPGGRAPPDERFDAMHHFPGVITNTVLIGAQDVHTNLNVLLANEKLLQITPTRVYVNYHTHKQRMVYGQLRAFVLDDFELANQVYIGAPILSADGDLVSVVTCRFDDYRDGVVVFPVSGVRSPGLTSGQIQFDDKVTVNELDATMSVYGRMQLPYNVDSTHELNVKRFAISINNNRRMYRDWPRTVVVFHNRRDVTISLVEGEFEMFKMRLDGPLLRSQL